ncbi:putative E3 ubiquitin-protein ligase RNF144A-B, partial [Drosera capensis]
CELCADEKPLDGKFAVKGCDHVYCADCVRSYVSSKLDDGVSVIGCPVPECGGSLEPEYCRGVVSDQCRVVWHEGMTCEEVKKMNEGDRSREDLLLVSLAKNQSWKRCPACKIYVERTQGCLYMRCSFSIM